MHLVEANGARIPALGLGTWTLKGDACAQMVARALEVGYRHIDTASTYGNEEAVGAGLKASSVRRDEIFLTTKVWYTDIGPGDLERAAEASLRRLGVDHVDLLLIHWPNLQISLRKSIAALNAVRAAGLASHIGVSNFPTDMLKQANAFSEAPLVCNQVEYHPYLSQSKVQSVARSLGMAMVSYCPLHRGGDLFHEAVVRNVANWHQKTPAQVILRWHVQQQGVVAIPRTTRPERLAENFAVFDFELAKSEMASISGLSRAGHRICDYEFSPKWDAA
ncbi:MAG: aldo/keto reductase [Rhizobiaceae bacterium]|nr:aldo/keto reductase [Rhizobiaceae bacterium]